MKSVAQLIERLTPPPTVEGAIDRLVSDVCIDSRTCEADALFCALPGTREDGVTYIPDAISRGAHTIVTEQRPKEVADGVTYIIVTDVVAATGAIASAFYDHPSQDMQVIGITGTNGKTTTATILYQLLTTAGHTPGLLSTIEERIGTTVEEAYRTTPDVVHVNQRLAQMRDAGCTHCVMEVSSHALTQGRIADIELAGAIFTNITHDHLDYHTTFEAYRDAKKTLFDDLHDHAFAVFNADDINSGFMATDTHAQQVWYSLIDETAEMYGHIVAQTPYETTIRLAGEYDVVVPLIGRFNAYNVLAAAAAAHTLGLSKEMIRTGLGACEQVSGRLERVSRDDGIAGIVDYAHTPDALANVLEILSEVKEEHAQLIVVIGCGGNRDVQKRPEMARIALQHSDYCILTADNPRDEDPLAIIEAMRDGLVPSQYQYVAEIPDRNEAIKAAVAQAQPGDIVLVAGKGHETYQEIAGTRYPFDDREVLRSV